MKKKGLLDKKRGTISDIVPERKIFEVHSDFEWVDIPSHLEKTNSALVFENGAVKESHRFIEGGSPKLEKSIRLAELKVKYKGYKFTATEKSQEALSRNIMLADEDEKIEWIQGDKIHEFTRSEAKDLLKLMTKETFEVLKEVKGREKKLLAQGFTERDLTPGFIPIDDVPLDVEE